MLNKWHVYNELIEHYQATREVMDPNTFQKRFSGQVLSKDAIEALYEFDRFLEKSRVVTQ
ncbi:hypothetical protein PP175_21475 [Aneurinibacillus sp. Ricciae_BoGa-3]|uniref:hypothetical protein n=1 Tax=Aneurinibacillus sp. Ricciae_BoGa-3 TaxID=3022697 RepID=UPI002341A6EB|nr:hypothetical protein [Aneurinibacillus sp. Ricciae_BoGa-3]WCK53863.1 hypothetical protein PP175_21475 [Aneurinibacillus sp. Ricciae_BoGa-3]